jgi:hypothetical protein
LVEKGRRTGVGRRQDGFMIAGCCPDSIHDVMQDYVETETLDKTTI